LLRSNSILHVLSVGIHFRFSCRTSYYNPPYKKTDALLRTHLSTQIGRGGGI
jgi:hypothetical protein